MHFFSVRPSAKSNKPHYQSKVFVCNQWAYAGNRTDVVDQLLIHIIDKKLIIISAINSY